MNVLKLKLLLLIQLMTLGSFAQMTTTFPLNENVKYGKLENGMTYYVLHNEEPKDRASFYFIQNVGAILEEDNQNGLAHFLEHMAFNGTEHFDGKGILDFLEKHGVRFGADINAYTAADQTIYNLSSVPTDKESLLDSCLLVLHDWSGYLQLKDEEIDAERGVIREEWRTRRNSGFRLNAKTRPVLFKDSKYAVRDVIGDLEVINNFKYQALRDYYKKWYRPDLQAVVVVGDFDADRMEAKIKELFSSIPLLPNLPKREYFSIPDNEEILFTKATDPEATSTSIALVYKKNNPLVKDQANYKLEMMESLFQKMMGDRFKELAQKPNSNSFGFYAGFFSMTRTEKVLYLNAAPKPGKEKESFKELMTEMQRVKLYGFTQSELDRAKLSSLNEYESYYKKKDKISNDEWAGQLANNFLEAEPVFTPETEYKLSTKTINSITLAELNAWIQVQQTKKNRVIMVTGPDSQKETLPSFEDLTTVLSNVENAKIEAYAEEEDNKPLVSTELGLAKIKTNFTIKGIETKSFILENGAKVVLMPTTYSKDEILFKAFSPGGTSLLAQEDLASAQATMSIAKASGIGEFDNLKLTKKLSGKTLKLNPYIDKFEEGFIGFSTVKDFETLLELAYLSFEAPRFDKEMYNNTLDLWTNYAKNRQTNNKEAFRDSISVLNSNHSPRNILFNEDMINQISFEKVQKVYKNRIRNASDFTFVFVGNIDIEKALPLIEKYIGNIKGYETKETPKDHNMRPAKGESKIIFSKAMEVPKATVYANLTGELKYSLENKLYMSTLERLLSKRYLATIREEEGGSYGVGVRASVNKIPKNEFGLYLKFDCDPEKQEKLLSIAWHEIDELKKGNIVSKDLNEIKQNFLKMRKEQVEKNNFWLEAISNTIKDNTEFVSDAEYEKIVNSISEKSVAKIAKRIFSKMNTSEVILQPTK